MTGLEIEVIRWVIVLVVGLFAVAIYIGLATLFILLVRLIFDSWKRPRLSKLCPSCWFNRRN